MVVSIVLISQLMGCGGGDNSSGGSTGSNLTPDALVDVELNGSVGDGPIVGATVEIYNNRGRLLSSVMSDVAASYAFKIKTKGRDYPLLLKVSDGTDLVTGNAPDFQLLSVAMNPSEKSVNINPFSTLVVKMAQSMGGINTSNVSAAKTIVTDSFAFGLDPSVVSDPITSQISETNVANIVKASEALGELVRRTRDALMTAGTNVSGDAVIAAIAADLIDGVLDGTGASGVHPTISAVAKVVSGQVLVEALSNNLKVGGVVSTGIIDQSIAVTHGAVSSQLSDSVRITSGMLDQALIALTASQVLDSSAALQNIVSVVRSITGDTLPVDLATVLPADASTGLDHAVTMAPYASTGDIASINQVVVYTGSVDTTTDGAASGNTTSGGTTGTDTTSGGTTGTDTTSGGTTGTDTTSGGTTGTDTTSGGTTGTDTTSGGATGTDTTSGDTTGTDTTSGGATGTDTTSGDTTGTDTTSGGTTGTDTTSGGATGTDTTSGDTTGSDTGTVVTSNLPPDGTIDTPANNITITAGDSINFTGTYSDPEGDTAKTYLWEFSSSLNLADSVVEDPGWMQFNNSGVFTVKFTVTDSNGAQDPIPAQVTVTVVAPDSIIIMDNSDAGFSTVGNWPSSKTLSGYYGSNYQYSSKGDGSSKATWRFEIANSGNYNVEARWTTNPGRATNAPYTLFNNGVFVAEVTKNQQINGGQFNPLGSYQLTAGTLDVVLDNNASGYVVADAVQVTGGGTTSGGTTGTDTTSGDTTGTDTTSGDTTGTDTTSGGATGTDTTSGGTTGGDTVVSVTPDPVQTGSITLHWTAPVTRTDGTPLSLADIDGYRIYYGDSAGNYSNRLEVSDGTAQSATITDIPVGSYCIVMTTYDVDGRESAHSSMVTKTAP